MQPGSRTGRGGGRQSGLLAPIAVAAVFFAVLAGFFLLGRLPVALLLAYVCVSVMLFVMYGADKAAAERNTWRTSEAQLHILALACGWPGALVAQRVFRHKTRKQPFRAIFWCTVVINCGTLAWFLAGFPGVA